MFLMKKRRLQGLLAIVKKEGGDDNAFDTALLERYYRRNLNKKRSTGTGKPTQIIPYHKEFENPRRIQ